MRTSHENRQILMTCLDGPRFVFILTQAKRELLYLFSGRSETSMRFIGASLSKSMRHKLSATMLPPVRRAPVGARFASNCLRIP